ncbi:MAG: Calx-beta domain-containing protein [Woeseiaceae bacterium]
MKQTYRPLIAIGFPLMLAACGGGGGDDSSPIDDTGGGPATPAISIGDATIEEGNNGSSSLTFGVSLSGTSGSDVMVDFSVIGVEADVSDFIAASGTLTIPSGQTAGSIDIAILGDTEIERDESFAVELANPVNATLAIDTGNGTIINDDFSLLSIGPATVMEGDEGVSPMTFSVTVDRPGIDEISVDYATSDAAALAGSDYAAETGILTIPVGDTEATFIIDIVGDDEVEADEQFVINLLNASSNARIAEDEATGLIVNDDLVKVSVGPGGVIETDVGVRSVAVPLSLDAPASLDIAVSFQTSDVTALSGSDYTALDGMITVPAGETMTSIEVDVIGDTSVESNEFFLVTLTNVEGPGVLDQDVGMATIIDNDDPEALPTLFAQPAGVTEGDAGTTNMPFLFLLNEPVPGDLQFDIQTNAQTATSGVDYEDIMTTITIEEGATSALINVTVINDTEEEADESFVLTVSNPSIEVQIPIVNVIGTIVDNDSPDEELQARVSIANAEAVEGDSGFTDLAFTVVLSQAVATSVTFDYATEEGSAIAGVDYNAASGQVTLAAGSVSRTIVVSAIGDTFSEDDETFLVRLSNLSGDAEFERSSAIGTILTDEALLRLRVADAGDLEGNDSDTEQRFVVSLDAPALNTVSFNYETTDGTAIAGEDYIANSGSSQILAGVTSTEIPVAILADTENEPDETYTVTLTNVSANAVVQDATAMGTIVNDDGTPGWQTPTTLGGGFDYHRIAMHPDGNGAAVLIGATDPITFNNPVLVARFSNGAWLDPEPTGGSLRIGFAQDPAVTMLDNDRILVAWPTRSEVQSALYDETGNWNLQTLWNEQGFFVDLANDALGNAALAFEGDGSNVDPSDILRDSFDATTETWVGIEVAENDDTGRASEPLITMDDDGNRLIFWSQVFSDSALNGYYYNYFDAQSASWSGPILIPELLFSRNAFLDRLQDGRPALITQITSGADSVIELWIFDPATMSWSSTGSIQSAAGENAVLPKFTEAGDGTIVAAWFQERESASYDIYANRYDPTTETWGIPQLLENVDGSANPLDTGLDVAADSTGNAILVWSQNVAPSGSFDSRIRASRYTAADGLWSPPEQIDDDDVNEAAIEPHIGMDRAGNAIVIWFYEGIREYGAARFIAP